MSAPTPTRHCWASRRDEYDYEYGTVAYWRQQALPEATCMLPAGHDGPHEWTPDDQIIVSFAPFPEAPQ